MTGNREPSAGPYARLDELTRIKNDFETELGRQPVPGQGGGRREQLSRDHSAVMSARGKEIGQLWHQQGLTLQEISYHLDQTDPAREAAQQDREAGQ